MLWEPVVRSTLERSKDSAARRPRLGLRRGTPLRCRTSGRYVPLPLILIALSCPIGTGTLQAQSGEWEWPEEGKCFKSVRDPIYALRGTQLTLEGNIEPLRSTPLVINDSLIVIGSHNGSVYFADRATREQKRFEVGSKVYANPSLVVVGGEETIVVGSDDGLVYFLDSAGRERRRPLIAIGGIEGGVRATRRGILLIASKAEHGRNGRLYFLKPDGSHTSFPVENGFYSTPLVIENRGRELIVIGGNDGRVYYFDANGEPIEVPIGSSFQTGGPVESTPVDAGEGAIVVGSEDGKVYSLDLNGKANWVFSTDGAEQRSEAWTEMGEDGEEREFKRGVYSSAAVLPEDGTIVIGGLDGKVYFINPDGSLKASYQTDGPVWSSPHVMQDGTVVVGSNDGAIYFLHPDGRLRARFQTDGAVISSPTSIHRDGYEFITVGSDDGKLYILRVLERVLDYIPRALEIPCPDSAVAIGTVQSNQGCRRC